MNNSSNLYEQFRPREFILNNLSIKKQSLELLKLINYPVSEPTTTESKETAKKTGKNLRNWKNRTWFRPILFLRYLLAFARYRMRIQ